MNYLDNFPSVIPYLQGQKILEYLEELKNIGEIQDSTEYDSRLQLMLNNVDVTEYKPLFKTIPLTPGLSSSEIYNYTLDQIRKDLEIIFLEFLNIQTVLTSHINVFTDKYLDSIESSTKELSTMISNLTKLKDMGNSFTQVISNIFSDSGSLLSNSDINSANLYQDPRRLIFIGNNEIAYVDRKQQSLILPLSNASVVNFQEINVDNNVSTNSEVDIELSDSTLLNLIDGTVSTYWYYNVLKSNPLNDGATLSLILDFGNANEINYFVVDSVAEFPMTIDSIEYYDEYGTKNPLQTDLSDTKLSGSRKFTFPNTTIRKIVLTVKQYNSTYFNHDKNRPAQTLEDLKRDVTLKPNISLLSDSITSNIQNPSITENLPITSNNGPSYVTYYYYAFGFENVYAGIQQYNDNGYFITKSNNIKRLGVISLDVSEVLPTYRDDTIGSDFQVGSFEYDLIKKDYDINGQVIGIDSIPILSDTALSVDQERLFYTPLNKTISLRFLGHDKNNDGSNIVLYRNNIPLLLGSDWRFTDRVNPSNDSDHMLHSNLTDTKIEILHDDDLINSGIYTVNYTPRYLNNKDVMVYFGDQIIYLPNNSIEFNIEKMKDKPETSDIFLKISIRNNTHYNKYSPRLNHYKLFYSVVQ